MLLQIALLYYFFLMIEYFMKASDVSTFFENDVFVQAYDSHERVLGHKLKTFFFFSFASGLTLGSWLFFLIHQMGQFALARQIEIIILLFLAASLSGAVVSVLFQEHVLKISRTLWPRFREDLSMLDMRKFHVIREMFLSQAMQRDMIQALGEMIHTHHHQAYYPMLVAEYEALKNDLYQTNYSKSFFCLLRIYQITKIKT